MKQKWEYHRLFIDALNDDVVDKLNDVGERGWEMVNIISLINTNFVWFIFKRPSTPSEFMMPPETQSKTIELP
jgi:hypothetical protein